MAHRFLSVAASGSLVAIALLGVVPAASAELLEEAPALLIEATLERESAPSDDPGLLADLTQVMEEADELEILNPAIVDAANEITTNPEAPEEALDELTGDQEEAQLRSWRSVAPNLQAAFETVRTQFDECRADAERTTSSCAKELRVQYQAAVAAQVLSRTGAQGPNAEGPSGEPPAPAADSGAKGAPASPPAAANTPSAPGNSGGSAGPGGAAPAPQTTPPPQAGGKPSNPGGSNSSAAPSSKPTPPLAAGNGNTNGRGVNGNAG